MGSGPRVGEILDGKYELVSLLGEGGMGAVYEAQHKLINRRLAVKFLHPQYAENEEVVIRFRREAQSAARIGHENIIEITDMGTASDGAPYIVMEYLKGTDVKGLIEDEGIQTPQRSAHIMVQALAGLQAAHDAGIIHRDLKPENVFLISKSHNPDYVKLLDFGISKFKELETDGQKALTQTGTVLGTPHYMSPEQARGEQDLTPRSDISAMGIILYQMLTGCLPFDAPNYNALLIKILTEDPPPPESLNPDLPEDLVETIKCSMARDADDRFDTCDEFRARLLHYLPGADATGAIDLMPISKTAIKRSAATTGTTPTPLEMTQSGIEHQKSKMPLVIGAAVAAVIAVVLVVVLASGGGEEKAKPAPTPVAAPAVKAETGKEEDKKDNNKIALSISAKPAGAMISIDGASVSNPYKGKFVRSDINRSIVIASPGFQMVSEMIIFDKDLTLSYELEKEAAAPAPKTTSKRRRKKSSKSSASKPAAKPDPPKPAKSGKKPRRKIDYDDPWN